jgi:hypothetical protein
LAGIPLLEEVVVLDEVVSSSSRLLFFSFFLSFLCSFFSFLDLLALRSFTEPGFLFFPGMLCTCDQVAARTGQKGLSQNVSEQNMTSFAKRLCIVQQPRLRATLRDDKVDA